MSPRRLDVHNLKSHFRDSLVPERNDYSDVGLVGQRWNVGRFKTIDADTVTALALTASAFTIADLIVTNSTTLSYLSAGLVLFTGTGGLITAETGFEYNSSTNLFTVQDVSATGDVTVGDELIVTTRARVGGTQQGTYPLTVNANGSDEFLALKDTTVVFLAKRESVAGMGSSEMLSVAPSTNDELKLYLASVTGGQRVYLWDDSVTLPNVPHTGIKPTVAIHGDILVGDIVALATNPMTYFIRASTGLAVSAVTQLFSSQGGNDDTNGGATIVMAPSTGTTDQDGYIDLNAYGQGSGALANTINLANRSAADTVTRRWTMGGPGDVGDFKPVANNSYRLGTLTAAAKSVAASAGTGTGTGHAAITLNLDTAAGTGCAADTNENDLKTYTLPANSLATNGDMLRVTMSFRCSADANNKRIQIKFGGTTLLDSSAIPLQSQVINVTLFITRTGSATQYCQGAVISASTHDVWSTALVGDVKFPSDPAKDLTAAQIIKATITQGATAVLNAVIQDMLIVEYLRKA